MNTNKNENNNTRKERAWHEIHNCRSMKLFF